jgi:hypothetical protein
MPLMDVVRLDTMVTVVDSGVFLDAYVSKDKLATRPELGACVRVSGCCGFGGLSLSLCGRFFVVLTREVARERGRRSPRPLCLLFFFFQGRC